MQPFVVCREIVVRLVKKLRPFFLAPQIAKTHTLSAMRLLATSEQCDRSADLNPLAVELGREDARVGFTLGRQLSSLVFVAVEAVDRDLIEALQIAFAHAGERKPVEPRIVRDEADDSLAGLLDDFPLGHAIEANIQIVQTLSLRLRRALGSSIGLRQIAFFIDRESGKSVVRRISQYHEDRLGLLDPFGGVALLQ